MAKQTYIHGLKSYRKALDSVKENIAQELGSRYADEKRVAQEKKVLKHMYLFARTMGDLPHVVRMAQEVEKRVERYHRDFYLVDLAVMSEYKGRLVWYVGEYGTYTVLLDNENREQEKAQRELFTYLEKSEYATRYKCFIVDTEKQTCTEFRTDRLHRAESLWRTNEEVMSWPMGM